MYAVLTGRLIYFLFVNLSAVPRTQASPLAKHKHSNRKKVTAQDGGNNFSILYNPIVKVLQIFSLIINKLNESGTCSPSYHMFSRKF